MLNSKMSDVISSMQTGYNATFELNEFGEPKIKSEIETIKDVLLFILFAKPGQYPSLPMIGYDIESKLYSFYDEINEDDIVDSICTQCEALRPYFNSGRISLKKYKYKDQPSMLIMITGTDTYPSTYRNAAKNDNSKYLIGLTYDDVHRMMCDIKQIGR